jgi:nucleoside-diphosphate-sugar epimerase
MLASMQPITPLIGAGDLGGRVARLRMANGDRVIAVRRRPTSADDGLQMIAADIASGAGLDQLPSEVDALVLCVAPALRDDAGYRALYVNGTANVLERVSARRIVFVSSTSVYGEGGGEWVDESTPARPSAFNGRLLREAELSLSSRPAAVVLRLSGLYGPGRTAMLRRAEAGVPGELRWTNRIHVDDAATALSHLLDHPNPEPLYLGNDDRPALESEVLDWLRARRGLPAIAARAGEPHGRRISNRRLRESGWQPRYADFTRGYEALVDGA